MRGYFSFVCYGLVEAPFYPFTLQYFSSIGTFFLFFQLMKMGVNMYIELTIVRRCLASAALPLSQLTSLRPFSFCITKETEEKP